MTMNPDRNTDYQDFYKWLQENEEWDVLTIIDETFGYCDSTWWKHFEQNLASANPLEKAKESMSIYSRHMAHDFNSELGYYQALQMKATILDEMFSKNAKAIILYNEAMDSYFKCWCWLKVHINNEYRMCFLDLSGSALLKRNFISQQEFDEVKRQCDSVVVSNNY